MVGGLLLLHAATGVVLSSYLSKVPQGAADKILGIAQAFQRDERADKVNLVVGAYRDGGGSPWVLPTVREAEQRLIARGQNKEYASIVGVPAFLDRALEFAYGPGCTALSEGRVAAVQTLSGTGACRLAADFYARFLPPGTAAYVSEPTWPNHIPIFETAGLEVRKYRYLGADGRFDVEGMLEDIGQAPAGSVFVLHACAHNPTGVDPTAADWKRISDALLAAGQHILVDMAYQGFASGDARRDAAALSLLAEAGHSLALAQSFAKNFGLYGERVGSLSLVCADAAEASRVESQLKLLIRPMYSSPPIHGALLVNEVLSDAALRAQYDDECASMARRISDMRALLVAELSAAGSQRDWSHVTDQIGMFAYTGLTAAQCDALMEEHAVYLTRDGRISMAGVNEQNAGVIAAAIVAVAG